MGRSCSPDRGHCRVSKSSSPHRRRGSDHWKSREHSGRDSRDVGSRRWHDSNRRDRQRRPSSSSPRGHSRRHDRERSLDRHGSNGHGRESCDFVDGYWDTQQRNNNDRRGRSTGRSISPRDRRNHSRSHGRSRSRDRMDEDTRGAGVGAGGRCEHGGNELNERLDTLTTNINSLQRDVLTLESEANGWAPTPGIFHQAEIVEVRLTELLLKIDDILDQAEGNDRVRANGLARQVRELGTRLGPVKASGMS